MRTIPYADVERGVAAIAGISPDNILAHEKVILANYITDAVKFAYEYHPWPELIVTEKRFFRDEWQLSEYPLGSEVYYNGKYYRRHTDNWDSVEETNPADDQYLRWYEVGEVYTDPEWSEKGLYETGARVIYNGNRYLAKFFNTYNLSVEKINFEYDGITPDNSVYWDKIETDFERYIPYQVTGKNTIGTLLSVHTDDPRYNDSAPLNWREGAEGIYVEGGSDLPTGYWVRYRIEPPLFNSSSSNSDILNFLAPAIKALSYKSWLIGDGQHEKSMLIEVQAFDLLVREVDKLNNQQDRNQQYSISYEPYRRVNSRGDKIVGNTPDKIGAIKDGTSDISFKLTSKAQGRQSLKKGSSASRITLQASCSGLNGVKKGLTTVRPKLSTFVNGKQAARKASAYTAFKIFTGKAHKSIAIGYIAAEAGKYTRVDTGFSIGTNISSTLEATRDASSALNITTDVNARYANLKGIVNTGISFNTSVSSRQARVGSEADSSISLTTTIPPDFTGTLFELDETLYTGLGSERVHRVYVAGLRHDINYELPSFDNPSNGALAYRITPYTHIHLISETGYSSQNLGYKQFRVRVREGGIRSGSLNGELSTETYLWDPYPIVGSFNPGLDWYAVYYDEFTYSYSDDWYPQMNPIPDYPAAQGITGIVAGGSKNGSLISNISLQAIINGELEQTTWATSNSAWGTSTNTWS